MIPNNVNMMPCYCRVHKRPYICSVFKTTNQPKGTIQSIMKTKEQICKASKTSSVKLFTKNCEYTAHVVSTFKYMTIEGTKLRPTEWRGHGSSLKDNSAYVEAWFKAAGYKFDIGNDAPKGGQNGNFIKVSKVAIKAFIETFK